MSAPDIVSFKASKSSSATKPKKDKSSKKMKAEVLDGATSSLGASEETLKKEKSTKSIKAEVLAEATSTNDVSENIPKLKKEKSNKKRKAEALTDSTTLSKSPPDQTIDTTSGSPPSKKRKSLLADEIEVNVKAPEPPSKKELRRLKKGKSLPKSKTEAPTSEADTSGDEAEGKRAKKKTEKKTDVEKQGEFGIWIGNLAFSVSKDDLRSFFVDNSEITPESITRIHMPGPNDKKSANQVQDTRRFKKVEHNKGHAHVDFLSMEDVLRAIELSEKLLMGRRVLIKNNKSFEGRPAKTKEESRNNGKPPSNRVFVGNLSFDVTKDSITQHFEKCGAIESVMLATFEDSGKCKGYGWIVFEELDAAKSAVAGFVHIEEEASDDEMKSDSSDSSDENSDAEAVSKLKPKKIKMRKWWVSKIKGRDVRREFAEDAQIRYKKRYGQGGTKNPVVAPSADVIEEKEHRAPMAAKVIEYDRPYAARLTGGIVESKGVKVTF